MTQQPACTHIHSPFELCDGVFTVDDYVTTPTVVPCDVRVGDQYAAAWGLCVVTGIENRRAVVTYRELDERGYEGREQVVSAERFFKNYTFAGR